VKNKLKLKKIVTISGKDSDDVPLYLEKQLTKLGSIAPFMVKNIK
jgi:hypothetical protein